MLLPNAEAEQARPASFASGSEDLSQAECYPFAPAYAAIIALWGGSSSPYNQDSRLRILRTFDERRLEIRITA